MLVLIWVSTFFAALALCHVLAGLLFRRNRSINRLHQYLNSINEPVEAEGFSIRTFSKNLLAAGKGIGSLSIFNRYKKYIQAELIKARVPLRGDEFITISVGCAMVSFAIFTKLTDDVLKGILVGAIGWFGPLIFVNFKKKARIKLLNEQLGDCITLISNSLKAGYSFFQAIDTISAEMSGSISEEFTQVKKEISLGITTETALENLVSRTQSDDLELVVTAILIQRQVGGNLSEILDNIAETIRERVRIKGEVKALTAQGRMSGIIISILPAVLAGFMAFANPAYISLLVTEPLGLVMIGISVAMELIGIFLIRRIVNIEV